MRHRKKRKLRGDRDRRVKELRALATALVLYERIETTLARARITRQAVEKMVSRGKIPGLHTLRLLSRNLPLNAVKKIVEVLGPRYRGRQGGFTRILRGGRYKDGTTKAILEFVK